MHWDNCNVFEELPASIVTLLQADNNWSMKPK
jgi:hypothetical protein